MPDLLLLKAWHNSLPFEGGLGWVLIKVIVKKVCTTNKPPDVTAPSPRISNTQLAFRIEILSSPVGRGVLQALVFIIYLCAQPE